MQPYGVRGPNIFPDEEGGPTSKHANISSNKRTQHRRAAHKIERAKAKRYIKKEIDNEIQNPLLY
jgi:hypothetical protein